VGNQIADAGAAAHAKALLVSQGTALSLDFNRITDAGG
jgi:hypothetical protein